MGGGENRGDGKTLNGERPGQMGWGTDDGWQHERMSRRKEEIDRQEEIRAKKDDCGESRELMVIRSCHSPRHTLQWGFPLTLRKRPKLCFHNGNAPREPPSLPIASPLPFTYVLAIPTIFCFFKKIRLLPTSGPWHLLFPLPGNPLPQPFMLSSSFSPSTPHNPYIS